MSGFFGIFNRNGKPIEEKTVNTMLDAMSYWGPDERHTWVDGSVAFGHAMLWNTPESKYEHLPLEKDGYVLTMDARIDNRDELITQLELPNRSMEEIGDSEFILAAYQKWGEECSKHLLGDFAFAIWDEEKQEVFCARDHVGIKAFYYYIDDNYFIFSNDIQTIVAHAKVKKTISDKSISTYIEYEQLIDPELTFFEYIVPLPAANVMSVSSKKLDKEKYWNIEDVQSIKYNSIEEYSNKLRTLVEDSVSVRLRTEYTVASHLSGGLDSSSIAVFASRKLRLDGKSLHVYNWMSYPDQDEDIHYHEWGNSIKIAKKEHMEHYSLPISTANIVEIYETHNILYNDTITFWYEEMVQKSARQNNVRVMLSGWGGDEFITNDSQGYLSGLFWRGRILEVIRVILSDLGSSKHRYIHLIKKLCRKVLLPLIPYWLYCRLTNYPCGKKNTFRYLNKSALKQIKKIKLKTRNIARVGVKEEQLSSFYHGYVQTRIHSWNVSGMKRGIEYRYPLLDKRIIEFAMGIPEFLYYQNGHTRFLFRYAMKGIIPDEILWLNTKPEPSRVNMHYQLLYEAQQEWMRRMRKKSSSVHKYINIELLLDDIENFKISMPILSYDEIDALSLIENAILLLQVKE